MGRGLSLLALLSMGGAALAQAPDVQCRAAAQARAQACTTACIERARAAVDASVQERFYGRACAKNCLKIEMFHGDVCP